MAFRGTPHLRGISLWLTWFGLGGLLWATTVLASGSSPFGGTTEPPPTLQESVRLYRVTPGLLPADGLLRFGLGSRSYSIAYPRTGSLDRVEFKDYFLDLEYGLLPGLHLAAELPYRRWQGGRGEVPPTGSGLGDGEASLVVGLPRVLDRFFSAVRVSASLPVGDQATGLSEGNVTPTAVVALTFQVWEQSQFPELRLHLNAGLRWNGNEDTGFGGGEIFQPWPPLYPAVASGGQGRDNDFLLLGAAVEFRQRTTSIYIEYTEARLWRSDAVAEAEYQRFLSAGLCWGRAEGLAVRLAYDTSLALDDFGNDFTPAYPDIVTSLAISYSLPFGGLDTDRDGIPNRKDRCPDEAEDRDGFQDLDGCPEPDNDGDGVPDAQDGEPLQPEDHDGFQDEDGVPDPDNDGDSIPDAKDLCPDEPEDFDGHRDGDGCPDEFRDMDNDGIEDDQDRCLTRPEDFDGFEDDDGCPELDNDLDGIEDTEDDCPDSPEDYDGEDDDDGCPEGTESAESASPSESETEQ
ncbi:MAG: thrombospondin type 3 repeat-containing protein [bacterium]